MAVEVESKGQLQEFLEILTRRRWQVILPAAALVSLGVFVAVVVPKKYVATTVVELRQVGVSISTKESANAPLQIKSHNRVKKVVQELEHREYLSMTPTEQSEFITNTIDDLKVTLGKGVNEGSNFVTIEYSDVQLAWAKQFVTKLRDDWIQGVVELDRLKSNDEVKRLFEEKVKNETALAREERKLTELRRAHNLSATQPVPGTTSERSEDPVFERLKRNEQQLQQLELDLEPLRARITTLKKQFADLPPFLTKSQVIAGTSNQETVRAIETQIREAEQALQGLKPANSQYKKAKDRLAVLQRELEAAQRSVTKSEMQESSVPNPEIAPLRKEIEKLETDEIEKLATIKKLKEDNLRDSARVDELQEVYRDMRELSASIERLSATLLDAERNYRSKQAQDNLLLSALAVPFEISQDVTSTGKPTEPNPWLIISFSIVAGLGIGLGIALLAEFSKSCFRSVAEVSRVMVVPILGQIDGIVTTREARARKLRRAAVGVSSLVFVGAVVFVTWAWAQSPDLLSQDLRDGIENLRAKMR